MKTEITEQERQAIEEADDETCFEVTDFEIWNHTGNELHEIEKSKFKAGAEFALSELRKPSESETGRTDEELVQKILNVMDDYMAFDEDNEFSNPKEVAIEIASIIPSSRCQENGVNVELWQLKKIQNALRLTANIHDCKCKVTSWDRQVIEALEFTIEAITNAEKQMK